ncbi:MAG TPA: serine hydrolase [Gemmatimonadales bacterium]|nr:serine hydrolase [Gemmatimonadales bacterium]
MRVQVIRAACAATLGLVTSGSAQQHDSHITAIDAYAAKARAEWNAPALAIAIVKNDSVVFAKGYGVLEKGKSKAADENTLFAIGSSSKAFTTASLAMLVDEGKLKWDDRAVDYLPGWQLSDPWMTREIRIRDLVTHRVGLERADYIWEGTDYSRAEVLRRIRHVPVQEGFRLTYGYNNHMFLAAGTIVERVSGTTWDAFVRQRILTPLGMTRSNTSITAFGNDANVATPHQRDGDTAVVIQWKSLDNVAPAGAINSSVGEMAEWVRFQLASGKWQGKQLVSERNMREMHSPQTVIPIGPWFSSLSPVNHQMVPGTNFFMYGLGWFLQDYRGKKVVQHGGSIDGMRALVGMMPDEKLGFVVLTNLNPSSIDEALMFRIFDEYLGGEKRDWSKDMLDRFRGVEQKGRDAIKAAETMRVPNTTPSLPLSGYAGTYSDSANGDAVVTEENGKLVLRLGVFTGDLEHWNYDTFVAHWRLPVPDRAIVTFRLDGSGRPAGLRTLGMAEFRRR